MTYRGRCHHFRLGGGERSAAAAVVRRTPLAQAAAEANFSFTSGAKRGPRNRITSAWIASSSNMDCTSSAKPGHLFSPALTTAPSASNSTLGGGIASLISVTPDRLRPLREGCAEAKQLASHIVTISGSFALWFDPQWAVKPRVFPRTGAGPYERHSNARRCAGSSVAARTSQRSWPGLGLRPPLGSSPSNFQGQRFHQRIPCSVGASSAGFVVDFTPTTEDPRTLRVLETHQDQLQGPAKVRAGFVGFHRPSVLSVTPTSGALFS